MAKNKKSKKSKSGKRVEIRYVQAPPSGGLLSGIANILPGKVSDQWLLGLVIGAGVTYVMSDDELRSQLIRQLVKAYGGVAGGIEELKEQIADIQAELRAEQSAAA
ncbi:YtxH domain-containing protein [Bosea sp. (in: a-proteobacteria)]